MPQSWATKKYLLNFDSGFEFSISSDTYQKYAELEVRQIIFPAHTLFFLAWKLFTACCENVVSAAAITLSCFASLKY